MDEKLRDLQEKARQTYRRASAAAADTASTSTPTARQMVTRFRFFIGNPPLGVMLCLRAGPIFRWFYCTPES